MFARVTIFQGAPDSVDGPIRFSVQRASQGIEDLPGFLGLFDLADRMAGHALVVTLWATKEARDASADFAQQVVSMRDYEIGHHMLSDGFPTS